MQLSRSLFLIAAAAVAACASSASAQIVDESQVSTNIAEVLLNLQGTRVVPNLIEESQLSLHGLLTQKFGNNEVNVGQLASVADVASAPTWHIEYSSAANASGQFNMSSLFTVMTLDPGAATNGEAGRVVRHYLANNVTLSSSGELRNATRAVAGWFSPAPPSGSGVHRYTTLVYKQGANFTLPADSSRDEQIDTNFDLAQYVQQTNLGEIVAASFFLCQNDDASASVTVSDAASTSAVPSASVSAAASSVSSSLSAAYSTAAAANGGQMSGASSTDVSRAGIALLSATFLGAIGVVAL